MTDLITKKREAAVLQQALIKNRNNIMEFIKEVEAEEKKGKKKDKNLIKEEVQKYKLREDMMMAELKPLMAEIEKLEEAKGNDIFNKLISNADARANLGGRRRRRKKRTRRRHKKRRKSKGRKRRRKKRTKRRR